MLWTLMLIFLLFAFFIFLYSCYISFSYSLVNIFNFEGNQLAHARIYNSLNISRLSREPSQNNNMALNVNYELVSCVCGIHTVNDCIFISDPFVITVMVTK